MSVEFTVCNRSGQIFQVHQDDMPWFDPDGSESPSQFRARVAKERRERNWENGIDIPSVDNLFE